MLRHLEIRDFYKKINAEIYIGTYFNLEPAYRLCALLKHRLGKA